MASIDKNIPIPTSRGGCKILHTNTTCHSCSAKPETGLLTCSKCKWALYCNKDCQKEHWKKHKGDCKELAKAVLGGKGSAHHFEHAREMIELMTRMGWRNKLNDPDFCVAEAFTHTLQHSYWQFKDSYENEDYRQLKFLCKGDWEVE